MLLAEKPDLIFFINTTSKTHTSYQPVPLFLNNIWQASAISRLFAYSTTFWFLMNQERRYMYNQIDFLI